ncbi:hypothetical protein ACRALDRAFT_1062007 [Sodiomyces alcalophilus JCM 7366]|uniref:uncharacterized protein n=1 Tax=Sodiomyces alcalophilus JCM 7366 TaxID=591952 RepID=UPI0039B6754D
MASIPPIVSTAPPDEPPPSYEEAVGSSNHAPLRPIPGPSSPQPTPSRLRPPSHHARAESSPPSLQTNPTLAPANARRHSPYPAYQNEYSRATSSSSSSAQPHPTPNPQAGKYSPIPRQFPPAFNVYRLPFSNDMILGEHPSKPIYALEIRGDVGYNLQLILHSGPTMAHPPLATLEDPPSFGQHQSLLVRLPPSTFPGAPPVVALDTVLEFPRVKFEFSIETGIGSSGGRVPMEPFEWRVSRGDAVASLGGAGYGWKLVRMVDGPPAGSGRDEWARRIATTGSDGFEVVAAVAETASLLSHSKVLRFGFFGTGNSGLLGERWAIMAVMTALGVFQRHHRSARRRGWT